MKILFYASMLSLLFLSCSPRILRVIPPHQLANLELEVPNTHGLNPGMEIPLRATVTLTNGKIYSTHPNSNEQRLLLWDDLLVQSDKAQFQYHNQKLLIDQNLVYTGSPDTVEIFLKINSYPSRYDSKKVIVDYKSDYHFNANGTHGYHGQNGYEGSDSREDKDDGCQGGDGSDGRSGSPGRHVTAYITDTIVHGARLFKCQFETENQTRKTMLFANHQITITANGGHGGNGGDGGDGGRRNSNAYYKGGHGGNAGHGASGGNITLYLSDSVYLLQNQFHLESRAGHRGKAGRTGRGIQNSPGLTGFLIDAILFPKKAGTPGANGFTDGKIQVLKMK